MLGSKSPFWKLCQIYLDDNAKSEKRLRIHSKERKAKADVQLYPRDRQPGLKWLRFAVWLTQFNCKCMNPYEKIVSENVTLMLHICPHKHSQKTDNSKPRFCFLKQVFKIYLGVKNTAWWWSWCLFKYEALGSISGTKRPLPFFPCHIHRNTKLKGLFSCTVSGYTFLQSLSFNLRPNTWLWNDPAVYCWGSSPFTAAWPSLQARRSWALFR